MQVEANYNGSEPNIARMGAALHAIVKCCDEELLVYGQTPAEGSGSPNGFLGGGFESLRPHSKAAVEHLELCQGMLSMDSPDIRTPFLCKDWRHVSNLTRVSHVSHGLSINR